MSTRHYNLYFYMEWCHEPLLRLHSLAAGDFCCKNLFQHGPCCKITVCNLGPSQFDKILLNLICLMGYTYPPLPNPMAPLQAPRTAPGPMAAAVARCVSGGHPPPAPPGADTHGDAVGTLRFGRPPPPGTAEVFIITIRPP